MSQSDHEDYQRSFPSSIPVRSPSPDLKNKNRILKTVSPTLQVRKQMTPLLRDSRGYDTLPNDENEDGGYGIRDFDKSYEATDIKRLRERLEEKDRIILQLSGKSGGDVRGSRTNEDMKQKLVEKDKTINDLKKVVATLSEKSQISESRSENERIKTLEIENERLGEIVRKLNKKETLEKKEIQEKLYQEIESLESKIQELAIHNKQLEEKVLRGKKDKDGEILGIREENEELRGRIGELLAYEERNKSLQNQNQRLLKLLTDKKSTLPEITIAQENEIFRLQGEIQTLKEKTAPEKMTLSKIRDQYNQSLKLFKEQVEHMVELELNKMQGAIDGLKNKLLFVESKIPEIDQLQRSVLESPVKLAQLSKSYIEQTADLNSEIKRERGEKRVVEEKLEMLQRTHDALLRTREEDLNKSQEKMRQSVIDIEQLKEEAGVDRQKHHEELEIIRNSHENEIARLKNKHKEEIQDFKNSTQYEISEVVASYNKEISVLKSTLSTLEGEIHRLEQEGMNKEVEYRRNVQIVEERLRNESFETARLAGILNEKEGVMKSLRENKQEIEELGEVRKRSQTQLQLRYNEVQLKYSQLLANHADTSSKYTQLLNKFNVTVQELQKVKRTNLDLEDSVRNLGTENEMIPELKNQITNLQEQLLNTEHGRQKTKIESEEFERGCRNLERQLQDTRLELEKVQVERQGILDEMGSMQERLVNFSSKTKTTVETLIKLETQALNPSRQFFRLIDEIAKRIEKLERENESLKGIVSANQIIAENLKKDLLKSQIEDRSAKFQLEQLKNDINHISLRLELKDKELAELRELLENRVIHESTILEEQGEREVNLEDVERLRAQHQRVINSFSTQLVTLKRTVIQTSQSPTLHD